MVSEIFAGAVAAGLALFAVAELAARWWIRHCSGYYVFPPGLRLRLHLDREALPELPPIARYEINARGERGREVPRVRLGETLYRVLVAGGSQPEGYFLDQDASWPGALQRLLDAPESRRQLGVSMAHVGSIARSGADADALARILDRVLPRYPRLEAIVILVGASDILRWLESGAPPEPIPPRTTSELFAWHSEGPFSWRPSQLAVGELARRARRRWLVREQVHTATGRWLTRARAMRAHAKVIHTVVPDAAPVLKQFEARLSNALECARAHADRVVLVRQPWFAKDAYTREELAHMWHGGMGQAWQESVDTYYSIEVTCRLMAQLDRVAAAVADRLAIEQIDLMSVLEPSLDTYYDFFHLTPHGAAAVAAAVAATLLRQHSAARDDGRNNVRVCGTPVDGGLQQRRAV
jgi:lysophospholipase L1-like esterase